MIYSSFIIPPLPPPPPPPPPPAAAAAVARMVLFKFQQNIYNHMNHIPELCHKSPQN